MTTTAPPAPSGTGLQPTRHAATPQPGTTYSPTARRASGHPAPSRRAPRRAPRRPALPRGLRGALLGAGAGLVAVTASLVVAPHAPTDPLVHRAALVAHLAALALGMGAVLLLDLTGARWALGRVGLGDVARLATLAHPAVWLGLAGLALSGALLDPDPTSALTRVKLAAVVLVCANGGYATALSRAVSTAAATGERLPRPLLARALVAGALSQTGWWTAVVIGVTNAGS